MRTKVFIAQVEVTERALVEAGVDVREWVETDLEYQLREAPLKGPRGGRYEGFGPIQYMGSALVDDDFMRGVVTFGARRLARYVRPKR